MHVYIYIFGLTIPTYGLMITLGVILANVIGLAFINRKYPGECLEDFLIIEAYAFIGGFAGAKILYLIVSRNSIDWSRFFEASYFNQLMQGGFVFYGGLIGGLLVVFVAGRLHHIPVGAYLQHYIVLLPFIHAFGRLGCFFAGCCYGIEYDGIGSVTFPEGSFAPAGVSLFPTQLTESFCLFVIAALILYLQLKKDWPYTVETYLILYGIVRFALEFLRGDLERGNVGVLSVSQFISIFMVLGAVISILLRRHKKYT